MSALILIELNGSEVSANSRAALTAALQLSDSVDALVLTNDSANASSAASMSGINTVKTIVDDSLEHANVEVASKLIADVMSDYKFLVSGSSTYSKNILPRVGALLDVQPISDVCEIKSSNTFVRPLYAGNVMATIETADDTIVMTVRATAFEHAEDGGSAALEAFKGKENIDVFILFPHGRVSEVQQKQMTWINAKGAYALSVKTDFDGCQEIVLSLIHI